MNKQKIIIFKFGEFPHLSETFIVAQMVTAIKLGYEVKILINKILYLDKDIQPPLIAEFGLMDKIIIEDYKIPKNKMYRMFKWFVLIIGNLKNISFIIKFYKEHSKFSLGHLYQWAFYKQFNKAAIFHIQYGTNKHPIDLLKKTGFFKPAVLTTFHGHDAFFPINGFIPNKGYYDTLFEFGSLVTVNTPYLADKVLELGCSAEQLEIVPVAVNTSYFYPKHTLRRANTTLKLITVGRLDKVKGHSYGIDAVKELIYRGVDVTLTIVGDGEEWSNLENIIKRYGLEDKVFMVGKKSQEQIREELWEHHLYLLTAVALPNGRRETQGLATLEAQACGLPAILFDSGGVKYTVNDGVTGFVCKECDVVDLVDKIVLLAKDHERLNKMSFEAVTFVGEYYSQQMLDEKWKFIYGDLSDGRK